MKIRKYSSNICVLLPLGIGAIVVSNILNNKHIKYDMTENKKIHKAISITNSVLFNGGIGVLCLYGVSFVVCYTRRKNI
jgi:hypothetical protein